MIDITPDNTSLQKLIPTGAFLTEREIVHTTLLCYPIFAKFVLDGGFKLHEHSLMVFFRDEAESPGKKLELATFESNAKNHPEHYVAPLPSQSKLDRLNAEGQVKHREMNKVIKAEKQLTMLLADEFLKNENSSPILNFKQEYRWYAEAKVKLATKVSAQIWVREHCSYDQAQHFKSIVLKADETPQPSQVERPESDILLLTISWLLNHLLESVLPDWQQKSNGSINKFTGEFITAGKIKVTKIVDIFLPKIADMQEESIKGVVVKHIKTPLKIIENNWRCDETFAPQGLTRRYRTLYGLAMKVSEIEQDVPKFSEDPGGFSREVVPLLKPKDILSTQEFTKCINDCTARRKYKNWSNYGEFADQ